MLKFLHLGLLHLILAAILISSCQTASKSQEPTAKPATKTSEVTENNESANETQSDEGQDESDTEEAIGERPEEPITAEEEKADPKDGDKVFFKKLRFDEAQVAYVLWDPIKNSVIRAHNASQVMRPASVSKVVSAFLGLEILGSEYRFETNLGYSGSIDKNGILKGDLFLLGKGDPFLTAGDLMNLVQAMQLRGITQVQGRFIFKGDLLPERSHIAEGYPEEAPYNPGISSLSSEFNRFSVKKTHRWTSRSSVYTIPDLPSIEIAKSRNRFDPVTRFMRERQGDKDVWSMSNHKRYKYREEVPVRQPSRFTAEFFRDLCAKHGISLPAPEAGQVKSFDLIHRQQGLNLSRILDMTLEYSNNVMAELVFMTAEQRSEMKAVDWLKKNLPTWNWDGATLPSGSGISLDNRLSPMQIAAVLDHALQKNYQGRSLWSLMPIAGWKGPLYRRFDDPENMFRVWAKTGSIDYVSGLAGYLMPDSNRPLVFAILINDHNKRELLNKADVKHSFQLRKRAKGWNQRAQRLQDKLVLHWIKNY